MNPPVSRDTDAQELHKNWAAVLQKFDSCAIANAIEDTGVRLRNEGFMDSTVTCLFPEMAPITGFAFPLRVRTSGPPVQGRAYVDRTDWWEQLLSIPEPRVLVVEDSESHPGTGALLGEVHANIYHAMGCVGAITNGAVRDVPALRKLGFAVFAAHVSVSHAYTHVIEVGTPVVVGGLKVNTGDLMHGDCHGVLSVPADIVRELPVIVARQKQSEQTIVDFCRSPRFSIEGLRKLLRHS